MLKIVASLALLLGAAAPVFAAPLHIVAFGDSATAGYLVPRAKAYPEQLQAALRKKGYDVLVSNAGVSGETTAGGLRRFDRTIRPDTRIAIVEFGTNDLRLHVQARKMRANLNAIVRTLRARGIEVLLVGLGSLDLSGIARDNTVAYAQWKLPPGRYRARDGAHFNGEGYAILVARTLPQIEALIARAKAHKP